MGYDTGYRILADHARMVTVALADGMFPDQKWVYTFFMPTSETWILCFWKDHLKCMWDERNDNSCVPVAIKYAKLILYYIKNVIEFTNVTFPLTFWRQIFFFQILAHPVFKMWVIQKPNKVALWNKRHFEERKMEIIHHV